MNGQVPDGPPPSYLNATSSSDHQPTSQQPSRSAEHDHERLPRGWVRRIDKRTDRKYYVDTAADPPRSIWHHPLDDDEYLDSLVPDDEDEDERGFAGENEDHHRQMSHASYPDELPAREQQAAASNSTSGTGSKSGFSGFASRFGHGVEDNWRYRYGMQPKLRGPDAAMQAGHSQEHVNYPPPQQDNYYGGRNYNAGPDVMIMGRGRRARGAYVDDQGYGRIGRRRRGGLIGMAIGAAMSGSDRR